MTLFNKMFELVHSKGLQLEPSYEAYKVTTGDIRMRLSADSVNLYGYKNCDINKEYCIDFWALNEATDEETLFINMTKDYRYSITYMTNDEMLNLLEDMLSE
jgi:hypothetical protein